MHQKHPTHRKYGQIAGIILLREIFTAYKKTEKTDEILKTLKNDEEKNDFKRIRCPLCKWRPTKESRWCCNSRPFPENFYGGCGTLWNTFETRGQCPTCAHLWVWTACLKCRNWSLHEDWYEK